MRPPSTCARHPRPTIIQRRPLIFSRRHPDALRDASGIARTLFKIDGYETIMVSIPVRRGATFFTGRREKIFFVWVACQGGKSYNIDTLSVPAPSGFLDPRGFFYNYNSPYHSIICQFFPPPHNQRKLQINPSQKSIP